jgi:hypothetical protein
MIKKNQIIRNIFTAVLILLITTTYLPYRTVDAASTTFTPTCANGADFTQHIDNEVDSRITGVTDINQAKAIFTTQNFASSTYVRNPNSWTERVSSIDLTGISPWNSREGNRRAGALITPRHIAFATHYSLSPGDTVHFVANDNTVVVRTVSAIRTVSGTDITLGLLNADVPSSITHYPIMSFSDFNKMITAEYLYRFAILVLDQEEKALVLDGINTYPITQSGFPVRDSISTPRMSFSEALISGDSGNPSFMIVGGKPVLIETHTSPLGGPNYSFYKTQIDADLAVLGGGYESSNVDITCFNVRPVITSATTTSPVFERPAEGTTISVVTANEPDGDDMSYAITAGNELGAFNIDQNGIIRVASSTVIDFNQNQTFVLTVSVTDDANVPLSTTGSLLIPIQNIADDPYIPATTLSVNENVPGSTLIGTLTSVSDNPSSVRYSLLDNENMFNIASTTGRIYLNPNASLDFESQSRYEVGVRVTDSLGSFDGVIVITVNDRNDAPTINTSEFSVVSGASVATVLGTISYTDQDGSALNFSIKGGNINSTFALDLFTGQLSVLNSSSIDYSVRQKIPLLITVTDSGTPSHTVDKTIVINITPAASVTTSSGGGGGSSGGGGGGSWSTSWPSTTSAATNATSSTRSTSTTPSTSTSSLIGISNNTPLNTTNTNIRPQSITTIQLQRFLNAIGFTVARTGAGSVGRETNTFGNATRAALARFQKANKITPAVGVFGPMTRGVVARMMQSSN